MTPGDGVLAVLMAAVIAAAGAAMLVSARRGGPVGAGRAVGVTLTTACVAAAAAFVPLPPLGGRHGPVHVRQVEPPETDPLSRLPGWAARPDVVVFRARFAGPPGDGARLWPMLAYPAYSAGTGWRTAPRTTPLPRSGDGVRVDVTLTRPERLVPHPFGVRSAGPGGFRFDRAAEALRTGTAVSAYTLTLGTPAVPAGGGPLATPPVTECAAPEIRALVDAADAADPTAPLAGRLSQLERVLSAHGTLDAAAPPGDDCASVAAALRKGRGTSDQYATAFAVAARVLGASSRVVAGFAPRGPVPADGLLTVRGADATAWPQIAYDGGAWVDYWPLPGQADRGGTESRAGASGSGGGDPAPPPHPVRGTGAWWPLPLLAVGAATVLAAAAVIAVRIRRRRAEARERRRAAAAAWAALGPRDRVLALWQRALRDTGESAGAATTARDVAATTTVRPLRDLAAVVDRVLYGRPGPDHTRDAADAERAAELTEDLTSDSAADLAADSAAAAGTGRRSARGDRRPAERTPPRRRRTPFSRY